MSGVYTKSLQSGETSVSGVNKVFAKLILFLRLYLAVCSSLVSLLSLLRLKRIAFSLPHHWRTAAIFFWCILSLSRWQVCDAHLFTTHCSRPLLHPVACRRRSEKYTQHDKRGVFFASSHDYYYHYLPTYLPTTTTTCLPTYLPTTTTYCGYLRLRWYRYE